MNSGELLDVLYEGVAVLIATRETGEHENGDGSISPESFKRIVHRITISISDIPVKELETRMGSVHLADCTVWITTLVPPP